MAHIVRIIGNLATSMSAQAITFALRMDLPAQLSSRDKHMLINKDVELFVRVHNSQLFVFFLAKE